MNKNGKSRLLTFIMVLIVGIMSVPVFADNVETEKVFVNMNTVETTGVNVSVPNLDFTFQESILLEQVLSGDVLDTFNLRGQPTFKIIVGRLTYCSDSGLIFDISQCDENNLEAFVNPGARFGPLFSTMQIVRFVPAGQSLPASALSFDLTTRDATCWFRGTLNGTVISVRDSWLIRGISPAGTLVGRYYTIQFSGWLDYMGCISR